MNLIKKGIIEGLIKFDDEQKFITYIHQNKKRNYTNPEEQVQAETYLKLVLIYGYDPHKILQFVSVTMGSTTKEADIIVYNDDQCQAPYIVVECKKQEVSELEFKQAIDQGFSYAVAEGAKYVWVTSGMKDEYFEVPTERPKARISIPDIPQFGVTKLAKFKYAKDGGEVNGQKLFELEIVTEDDLTRRFKQAHDALWGGGELNPSMAFDELDKLIFCKIWDEKKPRKKGEAYDFQIFKETEEEKTNQELMKRVNSLYHEGRKKDPEVFKDDIRLSPEKLRTVVGYLEKINLGATDLDSKGRAFETFMGSFFRGEFGQFFTPRNIVKFIIDVLPITNNSLVLDTSCGSGGFLLHVLDKIRRQADDFYDNDPVKHYRYWHDFAEKNLFGIEINEQIARTAKMNMIIHDDGHTNVIAADGLLPSNEIIKKTNNQGFANNRFDFITTNPPFGSTVKQAEQAYLKNYDLAMKEVDWLNSKSKSTERENQNTEVLFVEKCYEYLREGGYLAIVIPDGILTNSSLQYVRDWIEEKFRIVAVVSLPQTAFQSTGAGVKSSVLFLKKYDLATTENIQARKLGLQDEIKIKHNYEDLLTELDKEKKEQIKKLSGFDKGSNLEGKTLQDSEDFKEWKKEVNNEYRERIDEIKENLVEEYITEKQRLFNDYEIFMAIAEDIGYDATGKATNNNELDLIGEELTRFIDSIESGEDSFFLSDNVDKNKIFLVNKNNLYVRFDSKYYALINENILANKTKFIVKKLGDITHLSRGRFSHRPRNDPKFYHGQYPFIQTGDIVNASESYGDIKYTQTLNEKGIQVSKLFEPEIILITIAANIGDTSILTYPACFPDSIVAIKLKTDEIDIKYLNYYFKYVKNYLFSLAPQSAQKNINLQQLSPTPIVIPPPEIQNKIVAIMDNAYNTKKQKEAEAQRLLDSIDDYLLGELGIELPQPEENTVNNRIFYRKLSDISGGRFDAFYCQNYFYKNRICIEKAQYQIKFLKEIIDTKLIKGRLPKDIEKDGNCQVIQINSINSDGYIDLDDLLTSKNIFNDNQKLKKQDIIIVVTGATIGKIAIFENNGLFYLGGDLVKFQVDKNINPFYVYNFLRCQNSQIEIRKNITGATNGHLAPKDIENMIIPIPPLEKQNEIAEHITKIREKAKQLQEEAKKELEKAKIEVEKMILGD
ncbi:MULTISPECIES: N-6 DNA methylase [Planktothrix]|uniref:Genome sequencing data, contig C300 n=2 Tax=Planktothrix TaxID=54304 RepID=A0A6J7ZT62_PLARU|nr:MULTISPECIES: N-6 DNA methylase [Planktothrix]CAC5345664.1 Genome sequencing data, contig C300 [Planktothrix rubescens NIVA-CYA 18]CAD5955542.1 Putative type I restriction enzyme MjaXP M protein [Planktothrix rubescens NIVA-CYA 18]